MTISSEVRKAGPFAGNDVTTSFPFPFKVFTSADVVVVQTNPAGVETILTDGIDYTVTLNADQDTAPGGTVNKTTPLASGFLLTITSRVPNLQPLDLTNQGGFYPKVINAALDRLTILVQQSIEKFSRSIRGPLSDAASINMELPAAVSRASKFLAFDANGQPIAADTALAGVPANASAVVFTPAGTGAVTRTSQDKLREIVSVKDFGAVGNGVADDTASIQAAINYVQSRVPGNYGGGVVYFPAGKYRITGSLSITASFITLEGEGTQSTYLDFANGSNDCLTINGGSGQLRDVRVLSMALNGSNKTAGATIKITNAYRCVFQRLAVEYCITGFDIGINTNDITIRDTVVVPDRPNSLHGIYWHCPVDGSSRSDVLTLHNVVVEGNWSNATCVLWEGFCNTMVATHLRLLHAAYGLRIRNVTPSISYYPQFLNAFDFEAEGFKIRAVSIEAGACFKFSGSDINNLTGGHAQQGNADDYAFAILEDIGASHTRSIQIENTRIGLCRNSGLYSNARDVQLSNVIFVSTSMAAINGHPVVLLGPNSMDVQLNNIRCEEYGGVARASYGVQIENGARQIQIFGLDANLAQTAAINNLSSQETISIIGVIEPGGNAGSLITPSPSEIRFSRNHAGHLVHKVHNRSTANYSTARYDWVTGIANSYAIAELNNDNGTPFWQLSTGPAVGSVRFNSPQHRFLINGVNAFLIGSALGNYANDAAAAAGGVPLYGYYRNGNVVQQRVV